MIGNFLERKPRRQGLGTRSDQPPCRGGGSLPIARDIGESEHRLLAADELYIDFRQ